jgi:hypothetical protein
LWEFLQPRRRGVVALLDRLEKSILEVLAAFDDTALSLGRLRVSGVIPDG